MKHTINVCFQHAFTQTPTQLLMGFPVSGSGKEPACQCRRHKRDGFDPWVGKIPWRRARKSTLVFLPGEFHGQRTLAGYGPQGHKDSDTTEAIQCTDTPLLTQGLQIHISEDSYYYDVCGIKGFYNICMLELINKNLPYKKEAKLNKSSTGRSQNIYILMSLFSVRCLEVAIYFPMKDSQASLFKYNQNMLSNLHYMTITTYNKEFTGIYIQHSSLG